MNSSGSTRVSGGLRGQSSALAFILLAGLVIAGSTLVVYAGSVAISGNQQEASFAKAKESMEEFSTKITQVSNGGTTTDVSLDELNTGQTTIENTTGVISVNLTDTEASGTPSDYEQVRLGEIRYDQGQRALVFQGGALFEQTRDGTTLVSPAPVSQNGHGQTGTLTFPIITVRGNSVDDSVTLKRASVGDLIGRVDGDPGTPGKQPVNPLRPGTRVEINVSSEYYLAWGRMLEERTDVPVTYDHENQNVTLTIIVPPPKQTIPAAVLSYGSSINVNQSLESDSYDSTIAPYPSSKGQNGNFWIEGEFRPANNIKIGGSVRAEGGGSTIKNSVDVTGTTAIGPKPLKFEGGNQAFGDTLSVADNLIVKKQASLTVDGDVIADGTATITGAEINGSLYSDADATTGGNKVQLKASGSDSTIIKGDVVVDGDVTLQAGVTVEGDVYASGTITNNGANVQGTENEISQEKIDDKLRDPLTYDIPTLDPATDRIESKSSLTGSANLNGCPCTITAGEYNFNSINEPGDVTFDTTGGDITIYVKNDLNIGGNDIFKVTGPNEVRIYIGGQSTNTALHIGNQGQFRVAQNDSAPQLRVYTKPSDAIELEQNGVFQGVLYGANDDGPGSPVTIGQKFQLYGAVVGDVQSVGKNSGIHYDEALTGKGVFENPDTGIRYIQTTTRVVEVDE